LNPFTHLSDSLSASRIGTYLRCPLRYFFQYVEKRDWEHVSGAMILGQAVDVAMKNTVVAAKHDRDSVAPADLFADAYETAVEGARAPIRWPSRFDRKKLSEMGQRLIEALEPVLLHDERLKRIVAHDVAFTVPLLDEYGEPVFDTPLIGIFDFVEEVDGKRIPLELKTASNRTQYLPDKLQRDVQALVYGLAAEAHGGGAQVRYVSAVKLKTPEVIESENACSPDQLRWIRGVIVGVKRAMDAGVFVARPSMIECGGCPFKEACAKSGGVGAAKRRTIFASP